MNNPFDLGRLNGHATGIILKELVRRAIATVRAERFRFEVQGKVGYGGAADDMVTSADKLAQRVYLRSLRECFPGVGIVAEEDDLREPCTLAGIDAYFTLDPVDGTKALVRRQSHGVGTMIALVVNGQVVSAWIGDVSTGEVYGYRPGSTKVHRISDLDVAQRLEFDVRAPLTRRHVLLHDSPHHYSAWTQRFLATGAAFKDYEVMGGSIGTFMARLWKGEVGAVLLPPSYETPWDSTPVIGISERMGLRFVAVRPDRPDAPLEPIVPELPRTEPRHRDHDLIIVHSAHLPELLRAAHRFEAP